MAPASIDVVVGEAVGTQVVPQTGGDYLYRGSTFERDASARPDELIRTRHLTVDLDGWLFVWMKRAKPFDRGGEVAVTADHLQSNFLDPFKLTTLASNWIRTLPPAIGAHRGDFNGTDLVFADDSGPDRGKALADAIDGFNGAVGDELDPLGPREFIGGNQRVPRSAAHAFRQPIVDPIQRRVCGGVGGVDRHARGHRPQQDPPACICVGDCLPRGKNRRVVGDDGVGFFTNRLVEDRFGQIDAEENPSNPVSG